MKKLIFITFLLGFISCNNCKYDPNQPTTFCAIESGVYVVNNMPNDTLVLKKEIEKFIFQSQYLDSLKNDENKDMAFVFYKGDGHLTCDFKEGQPYDPPYWGDRLDNIQDLRNHIKVARFKLDQRVDSVWFYYYWLRSSDEYDILENKRTIKFNDIDSLFVAKQKEYKIK